MKDLFPVLESAVVESLDNYTSNHGGSSLSDLYLLYDRDEEKLVFYDDMDNSLHEISLEKESFHPGALRSVFQKLAQTPLFEKEYISKPFTVSLVDENFAVTDELIFLDDNMMKLDDNLWENIDSELDEFLKQLLN
ncbi:MAG: hypothetical protein LBN18_06855 [Dysgonamonadaceae bacterium]|jgi:hypothetical protein|nr:hypothetical protein [Dysgonamonadaceae bacterium]